MKVVLQRVISADVKVNQVTIGSIGRGLLIFLGVAKGDLIKDLEFCVRKVSELRVFDDGNGKMNLSALDAKAEILVVSQFTLLGDCRKGRRPSFDGAAEPKEAEEMYEFFVQQMRQVGFNVATGQFRTMMEVSLINDGPVTILIDSRE